MRAPHHHTGPQSPQTPHDPATGGLGTVLKGRGHESAVSEDNASCHCVSSSSYLEVAPDKLGHGVVVDVQGQRDPGLSPKPGSPYKGHPGPLGCPEACGQRRPERPWPPGQPALQHHPALTYPPRLARAQPAPPGPPGAPQPPPAACSAPGGSAQGEGTGLPHPHLPASLPVPRSRLDPTPTSCSRSHASSTRSLRSALSCRRADGQGGQRRAEGTAAPGPPHRRGRQWCGQRNGCGRKRARD